MRILSTSHPSFIHTAASKFKGKNPPNAFCPLPLLAEAVEELRILKMLIFRPEAVILKSAFR